MIRPQITLLALVLVCGLPPTARGEDAATRRRLDELDRRQDSLSEELDQLRKEVEEAPPRPRLEEVERRQGIMTEELRRLREALVLPETKQLKSAYGLGPAASKVYAVERGLSIGGYGEANFNNIVSDRGTAGDEFDFLRFVLYVGYKYNDWIVFNSETEFEHASTGKRGSVSVEFANLDFLLHPMLNARAGLVLVPMGFLNEIHEPPFFHGNVRPQVEQQIIPSTWRSNGFGLFGELMPGLQYRTYAITSFDAKKFSSSGVRDARQSGSFEKADDWSWVGRVDYSPVPSVLLGGSAYLGQQGQNQDFGSTATGLEEAGVFTQIYELHAQLRTHGFEARALGVVTDIDDADALSRDPAINPHATDPSKKDRPVADFLYGYYGEVAYDVLPLLFQGTTHYLAPWLRYSRFDTQSSVPPGFRADDTRDRDVYEIGLSYKPIPQVVLKLDYRLQDAKSGNLPDELRVGGGFVF
jgi:hypothetical protein